MTHDLFLSIREMKLPDDFTSVKRIWLSGVKDAHVPHIPKEFWDTRVSTFEDEATSAKKRYVYLNEASEVKGFLLANCGYIFELYVDTEFRRKGVGTVLLRTLRGGNPQFPSLGACRETCSKY